MWKLLQEVGIADHLTCLLRNLCAGEEAPVRHGADLEQPFLSMHLLRIFLTNAMLVTGPALPVQGQHLLTEVPLLPYSVLFHLQLFSFTLNCYLPVAGK